MNILERDSTLPNFGAMNWMSDFGDNDKNATFIPTFMNQFLMFHFPKE